MKLKLKERFVVTTKAMSPTITKVTLTLLEDLRLTGNGKAEQEVISQFETYGEGKDIESAQELGFKEVQKLADRFDGKRIRIQIIDHSISQDRCGVTVGVGIFEKTKDELFGLGTAPVLQRVEAIGVDKTLSKAFSKALSTALDML